MMRKTALLAALLLVGCGSKEMTDANLVKVEYTHKYGIPVSKSDWVKRGQDGTVRMVKEDGVTVTHTYRMGKREGESTYTFPHSDTVARREIYSRNELTEIVDYYPSGMPREERKLLPNKIEKVTSWYSTGTPQLVEAYRNGKLVAGEYYDLSNTLQATVEGGYGERKRWDAYGELVALETVEEGEMVQTTELHTNGTPAVVTPYVAGRVHGQRKTYNPDGTPKTVEEWTRGVQHGTTATFLNGEKVSEVVYVDGKRDGIEVVFRNGTEPVEQITWINGHRHGPAERRIGGISNTRWYFRDREVSKAVFDRLNNGNG